MSFVRNSKVFFDGILNSMQLAIIKLRYNNWTIAEYFRKQGAQIGDHCRIDIRGMGEEAYLISIGNHVFIANGVMLHTHDGGAWIFREEIPDLRRLGKIVIEDNCMIGAYAQLLPNIRIGKNSIVGAGSVVISDVPPNSIVMGMPARVIGSSLKYKEKCLAAWNEQKPPGGPFRDKKKNNQELKRHLMRLFEDHPFPGKLNEK